MSLDLLGQYQAQGVTLWLEGERLRFKSAAPLRPEQVAELKASKAQIIAVLEQTPETPQTLEDFLDLDHYPKAQDGELTLVTVDGHPVTDPAILTAWQAAKGEIQARLEARHKVLTAWAEALLSKRNRVWLTTPDDITCVLETSEGVDDPHYLAAEVLHCEACAAHYEVRTAPPAAEEAQP